MIILILILILILIILILILIIVLIIHFYHSGTNIYISGKSIDTQVYVDM